jgi:hypothetical protein
MHVVEMRYAKELSEQYTKKTSFLMGVQQIIPPCSEKAKSLDTQQDIQKRFDQGRADRDISDKRNSRNAYDRDSRDLDVLSHMIGNQIHLMLKIGQSTESSQDTERGPSRLKKGLRSDHQDPHGASPPMRK